MPGISDSIAESNIKDARSVKVPSFNENAALEAAKDYFVVHSHVDSTNDSGASVRTFFKCDAVFDRDKSKWKLSNFEQFYE